MRFAIWSPTNPRAGVSHVELFRQQIREVEIAEELGFQNVWFYEHHLSATAPVPSPNLMIAAAAQSTSRIRLGAMVNILPYRNPLLVAELAAMLDVLTDGRLDMGIGRGLRPLEFDAFFVPQADSREMFLESMQIIRRVWADRSMCTFSTSVMPEIKQTLAALGRQRDSRAHTCGRPLAMAREGDA